MNRRTLLLVACAFGLVLTGCAKKQTVKHSPKAGSPTQSPADASQEPSVRSDRWQSVPQLRSAYFEYDSSVLSQTARETLQRNAEYLKTNPGLTVLVEGHCDERGTTEYNLALGQYRASAVREYYGKLGISSGRIATISYGEEKPAVSGSTENAWSGNRRAETRVRDIRSASAE